MSSNPPVVETPGWTTSPDVERAFEVWLDQKIDERINAIVEPALRNHRPRGNAGIPLCIGAPGGTITPSATISNGQLYVPFQGKILRAEIGADTVGSGTFNVLLAKPGTAISAATTIFGAAASISLSGAQQTTILPASDWTTFIPGGSWLVTYCTAVSGLTVVTINLVMKCT